MPYSNYLFSEDYDENQQKSIEFFSALLGVTFDSLDAVNPYLSDIYINGESLADTDPEVAANLLAESMDINSHNVAMIRKDGTFSAIDPSKYINRRGETANTAVTQEAASTKNQRDKEFIDYINNIDLSAEEDLITVSENENDADYLKSILGVESLDENNMSALENIYIDGYNLSAKLGKDAGIDKFANAVREALSLSSGSVVSLMKKNSVFAKPKAVLPEISDTTTPEAREKITKTMGYVKSHRSALHNEAKIAKENIAQKKERDAKLFFGSLFKNPDPTVAADQDLRHNVISSDISKEKLAQISPDRLSYSNFDFAVGKIFNNTLHDFVHGRTPENLCYAYMLTKINPQTGENFTLDELLTEDSDEMNRQKKIAGEEFCRIFQAIKDPQDQEKLNIDHYNYEIFPTIYEMVEQTMKVKTSFGDVNNKEGVQAEFLANWKSHMVHDILQQVEKVPIFFDLINNTNAVSHMGSLMTEQRTNYLVTDKYLSGDVSTDNSFRVVQNAAAAQFLVDAIGSERLDGVAAGAVDGKITTPTLNLVTNAFSPCMAMNYDEIRKYCNGEPSAVDQLREVEKNNLQIIKDGFEEAKKLPDEDIITHAVATVTSITNPKNPEVTLEAIMHAYTGTPNTVIEIANSKDAAQQCEGACKSLLTILTGCPISEYTEKKHFKTAIDKIYINTTPAAEYFNLTEDPDLDKIRELEKKIAEKLLQGVENNGPEFVLIKSGPNIIKAPLIKVSDVELSDPGAAPQRQRFRDEERYNNALKYYEERKLKYEAFEKRFNKIDPGNKSADAYAKLLSATADDNELRAASELLDSQGLRLMGHYVDAKKVMSFAENNNYRELVCAFTGASTPEEAIAMADKLIINGKPISQRSAFENAPDTNAKLHILGQEIRQAVMENLNSDKWIKPVMLLNDKGEPEPVKYFMTEPKKPKPVEKLTGFSRMTASREVKTAFDAAYEKYQKDLENYNKEMEFKAKMDKRITEYNAEADMLRVSTIKQGNGITPRVRATNLDALSNRTRTSAQNQNTPHTLTQPTVQAPSLGSPERSTPSV